EFWRDFDGLHASLVRSGETTARSLPPARQAARALRLAGDGGVLGSRRCHLPEVPRAAQARAGPYRRRTRPANHGRLSAGDGTPSRARVPPGGSWPPSEPLDRGVHYTGISIHHERRGGRRQPAHRGPRARASRGAGALARGPGPAQRGEPLDDLADRAGGDQRDRGGAGEARGQPRRLAGRALRRPAGGRQPGGAARGSDPVARPRLRLPPPQSLAARDGGAAPARRGGAARGRAGRLRVRRARGAHASAGVGSGRQRRGHAGRRATPPRDGRLPRHAGDRTHRVSQSRAQGRPLPRGHHRQWSRPPEETMTAAVVVRRVRPEEATRLVPALAEVLISCVAGGASVSFMHPLSRERAEAFWRGVVDGVARGDRILLVAEDETAGVVGTVQVLLAMPENQPHRGEIAKLLVHPRARRRGIAARLMGAADEAARAAGKSLLVLDTVTGGDAERLYPRL